MGLNSSDVARGASDAEKSLKKLKDAVEDTGRDGAKDVDKLEDELKDVQRQSEKTERAIGDVGDSRGFGKASQASQGFKDEALANFSEVTSSFDGSMESIAELAQGTLGGVAGSLPGIGIAAGIAALGIGAITTALTDAEERSKEIRDSIVQDFIDIGDALSEEAVTGRIEEFLGDEGARKEAKLLAEVLGIDVPRALLVMAGDFESAGVDAADAMDGINNASSNVDLDVWQSVKDRLEAVTEGLELGQQVARQREDAVKRMNETERAQIERTAQVAGERYEGLAAKYGVPITADVNINVNDRALVIAEDRLRILQNRAAQGIVVNARPGEGRFWE
jgi:hypothetical protein